MSIENLEQYFNTIEDPRCGGNSAIQFCRSGLGVRGRGDVTAVWRRLSSFVEVALGRLLSCLPHLPKCLTHAVPKASATA